MNLRFQPAALARQALHAVLKPGIVRPAFEIQLEASITDLDFVAFQVIRQLYPVAQSITDVFGKRLELSPVGVEGLRLL